MKQLLSLPLVLISLLFAGQAFAQDTDNPLSNETNPAPKPKPAAANPRPTPTNNQGNQGNSANSNNSTGESVSADVTAKPKLTPKQYIANFYQSFADERKEPGTNKARNGLLELLTSNESLTPRGIEQIAVAIQQPLRTVGEFIDYEVIKEESVTDRIQVVQVIAHFTNQPFMNEFMFYKKEDGYWGLMNLRYDANPATMLND